MKMRTIKAFFASMVLCCTCIAASAAPDDRLLPVPDAGRFGVATLRLELVNYTPDMVGKQVTYGEDGAFRAVNRMPDKAPIEADGSMTVTFPVAGLTPAFIIHRSPWYRAQVFVAPGDTTVVRLDMKELARRRAETDAAAGADAPRALLADVSGPLADVAREYCDRWQDVEKAVPEAAPESLAVMTADGYVAYLRDLRTRRLAVWRSLPLGKATLELAEIDVNMELLSYMNMGAYMLDAARREAGVPVADGYKSRIYDSLAVRAAAMEEVKMLNDARSQLSFHYNTASDACPRDAAARLMGTDRGPYFDFCTAADYHLGFSQMKTLAVQGRDRLAGLPQGYREMIEFEDRQLVQKVEAAARKDPWHFNEIDSMSAGDMLRTIIGRYPGKALLIDFWGTWCGACLLALTEMEPLRDELKGRDIVYVHIAEERSPESAWRTKAAILGGEHYRLSNAQWRALQGHAGLRGTAPAYIVVDRTGKVQRAWVGFGGVESMRHELLKALGERRQKR